MRKKKEPTQLSEFKVTLERVAKGDSAVPRDHHKNIGLCTKLGGEPDWIQNDDTPSCDKCGRKMVFVAQIDSIEHISKRNPFGFDFAARDSSKLGWQFDDAGMIYVFYCFNCGESHSLVQGY